MFLFIAIVIWPWLVASGNATGCANVTIQNAAQAEEIRQNCKVITGGLVLDPSIDETIILDGITTIQGDITYAGCWPAPGEYCPLATARFKLSSSTLTYINGSLDFWAFQGLQDISFPNLERIEADFTIKRLHNLKSMDITNLAYLGGLIIEAPNCTRINHNGLRNFTGSSFQNSVQFWSAAVESIDSWYRYPITGDRVRTYYPWSPNIIFGSLELPNVKNLTVNWPKVDELKIKSDNFNLILGGKDTTAIEIGSLTLGGDTNISRRPDLDKLSVRQMSVKFLSDTIDPDPLPHNPISLDLSPLDSISTLNIEGNKSLTAINLSPKAVTWENFSLMIAMCLNLSLVSEYRDAENKKDRFWYWPKGNIESIEIYEVPVANGFL